MATRAYLRRHGTPASPSDLTAHNCLHYFRRGEQPTWSFEPVRGGAARQSVGIRGNFAADNSEALRDAALGGLGIALVPDFTAQADLYAGKLVRVLPGWRPSGAFGDAIYAIRPYSPLLPRPVRLLVDYLREALKEGFEAQ
ncbi:hypothetical protein B551_0217430 [Cupriavidus sp. HPC(L)]|nr:hypothetical protein B551_0217430 [Cupriavidus sp. HPC(L)]